MSREEEISKSDNNFQIYIVETHRLCAVKWWRNAKKWNQWISESVNQLQNGKLHCVINFAFCTSRIMRFAIIGLVICLNFLLFVIAYEFVWIISFLYILTLVFVNFVGVHAYIHVAFKAMHIILDKYNCNI